MDKNDIAISSRSTDFNVQIVQLVYTLTFHRCLDKTISLMIIILKNNLWSFKSMCFL